MKLIDKSALVAEIKRRRDAALMRQKNLESIGQESVINEMVANELSRIIYLINTLEVKEVDFEKEYAKYSNDIDAKYAFPIDLADFKDFARHFFELGLKAQHDNWKVVDNINPPQANRNKIYCVFTKGRHILAKVIDHPKDEESLQWKCTEFPHHRYDMCEGDKYMQIV